MEVITGIWIGILALTLVILMTLAGIAIYSGLFTSFTVGAGSPPVKSLVIMYKFGKGPYSDCGSVFNEACSINTEKRTIGLYYDDPKEVAPERLRWAVGSIIAEGSDFPDTEVIGQFMDKGFKVFHTPLISSVVKTQFPYTTPFSIFIAIFRVYPAMAEYVKMKSLCAYPYIEVYDGNTIHFMAPLARQDDFYVPEALEEDEEETPERELSTEPAEIPEQGQGDVKACSDDLKQAEVKDSEVENTSATKPEETSIPTEPVPEVHGPPACELPAPQDDQERRSVSAASFRTAKSEIVKDDEEKAVEEAVRRIQVKLDKSTPEGVQDSGISSTSNASHSPTPTPRMNEDKTAEIGSAQQDSSSNIGSSMDSISSVNSSVTTQSSCTSHSFLSGSSFTTDDSVTTDDCSTEVSCDLVDVSGESDLEVRSSPASQEPKTE